MQLHHPQHSRCLRHEVQGQGHAFPQHWRWVQKQKRVVVLQQGEDSFLAYVQKVLTFSAACASLMMKRTTEGSKGKGGEFCCCSGCGEVVCKRSSIGRFSFSFANFALCHHDHVLGLQPLLALAHAHGTSTARRTAVAILLVLVR